MRPIIRVIDLETKDGGTPGIVEYGHCDLVSTQIDMLGNPYEWEVGQTYSTLVNPRSPIDPDSCSIHNIIDADVAGAPVWEDVYPDIGRRLLEGDVIVAVAAHNIECEEGFIGQDITGDIPWICTYKVALKLWPESPRHSNGCIRYYLNPTGLEREKALPVHRAGPDSYVTAFILREALNAGHSVEEMVKWTREPSLLARCKVGKDYYNGGKGTEWENVETSMLHWLLDKKRDDVDICFTARHHLQLRETNRRLKTQEADLNKQFVDNGMPTTKPEENRYGIHGAGKPATDFTGDRSASRDHPARDTSTKELDL